MQNINHCAPTALINMPGIANRLKNDYSRCPDIWQRSIAGCYQNNVA
ncbi:hypothetical protein [Symbiopectobacterium purcellii]